jgi:predicted AlkP superfamily phosphohydrolase/phosphomutase
VLRPLLDAGRLPNLEALIARGTVGLLRTYGEGGREPAGSKRKTLSPIIWTTIATGKNPNQHGIDGFLDRDGHPYTSNARRGKALWNIADDYGLTSYVCGWWVTFPVEAIRGVMVSAATATAQESAVWKGTVLPDVHGQFHPASVEAELAPLERAVFDDATTREQLVTQVFGADHARLPKVVQELIRESVWSLLADEFFVRATIELLHRSVPDLTMIYVGSTDVIGHRFFGYRDPSLYKYQLPGAGTPELAHALDRTYELADAWLGQLIAALPANARLVLLSDHGMHQAFTEYPSETFHSGEHQDGPPGMLVVAGAGLANRPAGGNALTAIGTVEDIAPTVLAMLGIPSGADMEGRTLTGLFARGTEPKIETVPSHDEGFRPPSRSEVDPAIEDAYKRRYQALGYTGFTKPADVPAQKPPGK